MGCEEAHGEERWVLFPQHLFVILPPLCIYKIHSVMCMYLSPVLSQRPSGGKGPTIIYHRLERYFKI